MDNQIQPDSTPTTPPDITFEKTEAPKRNFILVSVILLAIMFLGYVGYLVSQNIQLKKQIPGNEIKQVSILNSPSLTVSPSPPIKTQLTVEELKMRLQPETVDTIVQIYSLLPGPLPPFESRDTVWREGKVKTYLYGIGISYGSSGNVNVAQRELNNFNSVDSFLITKGFSSSSSTEFYPYGEKEQQGKQYKKGEVICNLFYSVASENEALLEVSCGDMSLVKSVFDESKSIPL